MNKNKGFTLIELLAALVIIGALVASAYVMVIAGNEARLAKTAADDYILLDRMINNIEGPGTYTIKNVPTPMIDTLAASDTSGVLTRDDGNIYLAKKFQVTLLASEGIGFMSDNSYKVVISGMGEQECIEVGKALWGLVDRMGVLPPRTATIYNAKSGAANESAAGVASLCTATRGRGEIHAAKQLNG